MILPAAHLPCPAVRPASYGYMDRVDHGGGFVDGLVEALVGAIDEHLHETMCAPARVQGV
jgi:hypothetical protein